MNRRDFLASLGFGTVAAAAAANGLIDVERLLWIPGEKTIILPSECGVTCDWVTKEALRVLVNKLSFPNHVFDRVYDPSFVASQRINVRMPRRFLA